MTILFIIIMHHIYHQITMKMYLLDYNMIQINEELFVEKNYFGLIIK